MTSTTPRPNAAGWMRVAWRRLGIHWVLKMTGTMGGMALFFVVYFRLLNHPVFPVTVMPVTALDRLIPFQPETVLIYFSLWLYVSLAPALLTTRRELLSCGAAWVGLSVAGLGIFLFWPTAVPPRALAWAQHPGFGFMREIDAAGNACPSLHVAFAVLTATWFARLLGDLGAGRVARVGNWLWCGAILYSTVATRQHVVLDVVAGAALGAGVAWAHRRSLRPWERAGRVQAGPATATR